MRHSCFCNNGNNPKRSFSLVVFITICFVFIFLYSDNLVTNQNKNALWDLEEKEMVNENYSIFTKGCRILKMDLLNEKIKKFFPSLDQKKPKEIDCGSPALTASNETHLWINLTKSELEKFYKISSAEELRCLLKSFERIDDYEVKFNEKETILNDDQAVKVNDEFVQVNCSYMDQEIDIDYHSFVLNRDEKLKSRAQNYNVMFLGIDSVSRLNFHRLFKSTAKTILKDLEAIEMFGYNKVGDNTYPNLIPLLTGMTVDELDENCLSKNPSKHFDDCHFIWDDFKNKSYQTAYGEDSAWLSLFNYVKHGFDKQPTDLYFRTVFYQMEKEIAFNKIGNYKICFGKRRSIDVLYDYVKKFIRTTKNQPWFSFFWSSSMTHDSLDSPMIDKDLSELLQQMKNEKYLENTILFILSDHGMRFGRFRQKTFQGMVEERLRKFQSILKFFYEKQRSSLRKQSAMKLYSALCYSVLLYEFL
jgi:hypothetical protein